MKTTDGTTPPTCETGSTLIEFDTGSGTQKMLPVLMSLVRQPPKR